jgi:hypothetical protein
MGVTTGSDNRSDEWDDLDLMADVVSAPSLAFSHQLDIAELAWCL